MTQKDMDLLVQIYSAHELTHSLHFGLLGKEAASFRFILVRQSGNVTYIFATESLSRPHKAANYKGLRQN